MKQVRKNLQRSSSRLTGGKDPVVTCLQHGENHWRYRKHLYCFSSLFSSYLWALLLHIKLYRKQNFPCFVGPNPMLSTTKTPGLPASLQGDSELQGLCVRSTHTRTASRHKCRYIDSTMDLRQLLLRWPMHFIPSESFASALLMCRHLSSLNISGVLLILRCWKILLSLK